MNTEFRVNAGINIIIFSQHSRSISILHLRVIEIRVAIHINVFTDKPAHGRQLASCVWA